MEQNYRSSKLSLLAKYDDMCRYSESNIFNENEFRKILTQCEINRIKWQSECRHQLKDTLKKNESLEKENQQLKRKVAQLQESYRVAIEKCEQTAKDSHNLRQILATIREFVDDDDKHRGGATTTTATTTTTTSSNDGISDNNESIILNSNRIQNQMQTCGKHLSNHDHVRYILNHTDDLLKRNVTKDATFDTKFHVSNDDRTYIKSPETYYVGELKSTAITSEQLEHLSNRKFKQFHQTNGFFQNENFLGTQNLHKKLSTVTEIDHNNDADDEKNSKSDGDCVYDDDNDEDEMTTEECYQDVDSEENRTMLQTNNCEVQKLSPNITQHLNRTIADGNRYFTPNSVSSPTAARYFNSQCNTGGNHRSPKIKMDLTRLDQRPHTLLLKKMFKPNVICVPCGKTIGFCARCLVCNDCRTVSHVNCQVGLSLPCIPHYTPRGLSRTGSHMLMVGDFTAPDTRPFVPPLLVHCCNEIKKRALHEQGLYRKCGNDRDVRELKVKFLHSKTGPPNIRKTDRHVICGVVKMFLRDLDDPLVTRILWHDFIRATANSDSEKSTILLKRAIEQLPDANRDTLAFLVLHLIEVANHSDQNRMSLKSLAKIFGPTVIGYSIANPPANSMIAENIQQIHTMECLLRLPSEFWQQTLTDPNTLRYNNAKNFQTPRSVGRANISALSPYSFRSANSSVYVTPNKASTIVGTTTNQTNRTTTTTANRNRLFLDPIF